MATRTASTRSSTKKKTTKKKPAARRRRANRLAPVRSALAGHEADFAGLLLLALALVGALAIWLNLAGAIAEGVRIGVGTAVGVAEAVVPLLLGAAGLLLIRDRPLGDRTRLAIGGGLVTVAVTGLAHVARGPELFPGGRDELRRAGGIVGALVGHPLENALSSWGAALLLVGVGLAGLLIITRTTIAAATRRATAVVKPSVSAARRALGNMTTLAGERLGMREDLDQVHSDGEIAPTLYDVETEDDALVDLTAVDVREPRRRRPKLVDPADEIGPTEQLAIDLGPGADKGPWKLPPRNLLHQSESHEIDRTIIEATGRQLEGALAAHGVETRLVGMTIGPTVTRYELELGPGVRVARVTALQRDIAYAMAAEHVRILAPIPGKSAIGVEVPNRQRQLVALGDILASAEARQATHPLEVAVGRDIAGRAVFMNLATTPHLLIAGATGKGKSSLLNAMVTSLLMRNTPDQVRLILVDPKRVEMGQYNRLPHLLTQVVTVPKKAANALQWAVHEMERRYDLLHGVGVRDITGYNAAFDRGELVAEPGSEMVYERLPFIVIVVDELNDLMMVAARDVEESICRIAQMARAVGIHLVIATQRPSVNVITGVIKANIPARVALAVASQTDSRVVLDQVGAERLVGLGDMLLLGPTSSIAQRIQGAFVSEDETRKVVAHWRRQAPEPSYESGVEGDDADDAFGEFMAVSGDDADDEALMRAAIDLVVRSQLGSTSMLQRKLKIGFARAGRIMDLLEQRGLVGPSEGSKARVVLMTAEELDGLLDADRHR
ncbi:MAG: DNA translocase FtsK 4TM domain-containing protein [Acidimicrobiales bacterium]